MQNARHLLAATLAAAGLFASAGLASARDNTAQTVKPYQGVMLDVGSKQLGGYFVAADGRCKLTAIVADGYHEDRAPAYSAMRVQLTVDVGKPAQLDTAEGKAVQFECLNGAQAMKASLLDRLAYYAPAK
ncbi:hypothetical protein K9U39_13135 [Rhodoblastus acidophilus]|uniref:Uncharacterized protein n=1 Tax=Candidatus Rhodoblastus alkanivorans TaxID=2954117 RepID=A0ABS9ZA40_9HYPH|nr:hypothetical protein [Candidatus Rhodoblastus alkanivorans]MCI4677201.1 hypothetical protein [Candidatus Rhodoblastus alkanivorans]MCI4684554.1 hypothetical protein [Candidatus Rhodoblastus alkanivorans]MDI4641875.1 hypothetical protein [Rhodoblastus acidophilus]